MTQPNLVTEPLGMFDRELGAPTRVYSANEGVTRVWWPAPDVIAAEVEGKVTVNMASEIYGDLDRKVSAGGRLSVGFHDWERVEGYEWSARIVGFDWTLRNRRMLTAVHILMGHSPVMNLAVSAANFALGGLIVTYRDRKSFEESFRATLARRKKNSPSTFPAS
jgi:hypothetical protein